MSGCEMGDRHREQTAESVVTGALEPVHQFARK
jgi:hypothetical protein